MLSIIPHTLMTLACLHAVRGESGRAMSSSFPGSSTKIDGKFNKFNILRYARDTMFLYNDTMNLPADDNPYAFAEVYSRSLIRSQTDVMVTVPTGTTHHMMMVRIPFGRFQKRRLKIPSAFRFVITLSRRRTISWACKPEGSKGMVGSGLLLALNSVTFSNVAIRRDENGKAYSFPRELSPI